MSTSTPSIDAALAAARDPHVALEHLFQSSGLPDHLEALIMGILLMEVGGLSRSQVVSLVRLRRRTGLNLAHLALRHSLCRYRAAYAVVRLTRQLLGAVRHPGRLAAGA